MYTFVYRTFIKFILFCRGQALFSSQLQIERFLEHLAKWHCVMLWLAAYLTGFPSAGLYTLYWMLFCRGQAPDVSRPHPSTYIRVARFTFVQPIEPFVSQLASNKPYMQHFENNQYINSGHSQVKDTNVLYHPLQVDTSLQC